MRVIENNRDLAKTCREASSPLGLVPTMGALHQGHLALVKRARQENETLAVSIFVNPTQFGAGEDLVQYPRDLAQDLDLLRGERADLVFAPPVEEMYPPGFDTWVNVDGLSDKLEGAHRPGHFRGVATVVTKLFNLLRPDRAYFGQKDGQQVAVIRRLLRDLHLDLEMVVVPTVREADGLAHSTRNRYLSPEQRRAAPVIFSALCRAEVLWRAGERDADKLRHQVRQVLEKEPLVAGIDYVSVADPESMEELEEISSRAMVSTALHLGKVRLIDNIILE
jgi:pantoate--beta-alanine ligase